jgi:uncharacterized membrane protein
MSTVYLVADWVTLLYFCLSTMFAAIILLFFFGKKLGLMRFAAFNWGISNIANAGWVFVSDQVLQRDVVSLWLSLGQLLLAILAFALAMLFVIVSKKTEKDGTAITLTVLSRPYTDDNSEVAEATNDAPTEINDHVGPSTPA